MGRQRKDQNLRRVGAPRPERPRKAGARALPRRADRRLEQRIRRGALGCRVEQVRRREGGFSCHGVRGKGNQRRQPAPPAGGDCQQSDPAAGPVRRGQPHRAPGAWRLVLHRRERITRVGWPLGDAAVSGSDLRRHEGARVQRLPEPVRLQHQGADRGGCKGAADERTLSESGRAEPRDAERQGSELPGRRRIPDSRCAGRGAQCGRDDHIQGIRRAPEVHADRGRRRSHSAQGRARGQRARLRQRRQHPGLPRAGAVNAAHRNGS